MADVAKVVDGLRDQNGAFTKSYYEMSDALLNMSKSIPMTADALGQIMVSAGQAGIASEDLAKFTETAAKMGVAFNTVPRPNTRCSTISPASGWQHGARPLIFRKRRSRRWATSLTIWAIPHPKMH